MFMKIDQFTYPRKLDPRPGGRPLEESEIQERLQKIVEFYILNGVFPDVGVLLKVWNLSKPSVIHTLNMLAERDSINLYISHGRTIIGLTDFQLQQVNLDGQEQG